MRQTSQAMLDKVSPIYRNKCGSVFGRLAADQIAELTWRLMALLGAA